MSRLPHPQSSQSSQSQGPADPECGPQDHRQPSPRKAFAQSDATFERAAAVFRAAGDLARLKLLARLADGEQCVSELAEAAGVGLSTVSQQLRQLRAERLVKRHRAGKHVFYSLADAHILELVRSALEHAAEDHPHPSATGDD